MPEMEQSVQSNDNSYLDIMVQSLTKKLAVLDAIEKVNMQQKEILEDDLSSPDAFDKTVDQKSEYIDQLDQLDSGFDKLFDRVKELLETDRESYRDKIIQMQELIRQITDRSVDLQKQEARNKELMTNRFAQVKHRAKSVRANSKATTEYYKTMMKSGLIDPQFMDNKK